MDVDRRPLGDIGRFVVWMVARPLNRVIGMVASASGLRLDAAVRPADAIAAYVTNYVRCAAWIFLTAVWTVPGLIADNIFSEVDGGRHREFVWHIVAFGMAIAMGNAILSGARAGIAARWGHRGFPEDLVRPSKRSGSRLGRTRRGLVAVERAPSKLVRWLSTPSSVDTLVLLLVATPFALS